MKWYSINVDVIFFDKNGNLVATGRLVDNLFKLNTVRAKSSEFACIAKSEDIELLHKRLGHVSLNNMKFLKLKVPNGLKCKVCRKGKHGQRGPTKVRSIGGCRFFVTFIDDFSRKLFVFTLNVN